MMLGKDALCWTLVSTLVANDFFLTGHRMRRKGMTEQSSNPLGRRQNRRVRRCKAISNRSQVPSCDGLVTWPRNAQRFTE